MGMDVRLDGTISNVHIGSPAQTAGFGPGMKLLTINQHPFSIDGLQQAIRDAKGAIAPIECTVDNTGVVITLRSLTAAANSIRSWKEFQEQWTVSSRLSRLNSSRRKNLVPVVW